MSFWWFAYAFWARPCNFLPIFLFLLLLSLAHFMPKHIHICHTHTHAHAYPYARARIKIYSHSLVCAIRLVMVAGVTQSNPHPSNILWFGELCPHLSPPVLVHDVAFSIFHMALWPTHLPKPTDCKIVWRILTGLSIHHPKSVSHELSHRQWLLKMCHFCCGGIYRKGYLVNNWRHPTFSSCTHSALHVECECSNNTSIYYKYKLYRMSSTTRHFRRKEIAEGTQFSVLNEINSIEAARRDIVALRTPDLYIDIPHRPYSTHIWMQKYI